MINPDPKKIPPYRLDQLMMTFDPADRTRHAAPD